MNSNYADKISMAVPKCNAEVICQELVFCVGGFKKPSEK